MSDVVTGFDKSSRETNCDRRKARQNELNNKLVRSVSLDAGYTGPSNAYKKIKINDNNEEVILNITIIITLKFKILFYHEIFSNYICLLVI